jgi:hypothetical protein
MAIDLEEIERQILDLVTDDSEDVTLEDLTQEVLEGSGVFDTLMRAMSNHLEKEHTANRITGDQYAQVYSAALTQVLQQSIAFLLGKGRFRLERSTTLLQLAKLDKEIALLCQRLVTEKTQVMDATILDPTASDGETYVNEAGEAFNNTIQPVQGTTGRKNTTIDRQRAAYDDDYKTKVGGQILDAHKVLLSNIIDLGTLPTELDNASIDQLVEHMKIDSQIVNNPSDTNTQIRDGKIDSNQLDYTTDQFPAPEE